MCIGEYYDSRKSVDLSRGKEEKRNSGGKTFKEEFNDNLTLTDSDADEESEEEKDLRGNSKGYFKKRQRFRSVSTQKDVSLRKRRLSFSDTLEELFIATFPVSSKIDKGDLEDLVEEGVIMDESQEYVEHLHRKRKKYSSQKSI